MGRIVYNSLINPLGVIVFASWIATAHRFRVSIGLGCLLSAGLIAMYYIGFAHDAFYYSDMAWLEFGFVVVLNFSGLLVGILAIKAANDEGATDKSG